MEANYKHYSMNGKLFMVKINPKQLWELSRLVSESFDTPNLINWGIKNLGKGYTLNTFKTDKGDEVVQLFNSHECLTFVGGSSGDKKEWRGNFNAFKWGNIFSRRDNLVCGLIHCGFYNGAISILDSVHYIKRPSNIIGGYSRGAGIASVMCYLESCSGFGFGTPKAFVKKVLVNFLNIRNPLDPVVHVVPFFKTIGRVVKVKFIKNPHTGYGKHLENIEGTR